MTEQELISMIVDEITDYELSRYREEHHKVYDNLNSEISRLGDGVQTIIYELPQKSSDVIQRYIAKIQNWQIRTALFCICRVQRTV